MSDSPLPAQGELAVAFLAEGEQPAEDVAARLVQFIGAARRTLDLAVYDFRLSPPLRAIVAGALAERATAGVAIRIAYDADKAEPPSGSAGMDPAPAGTGAFVQGLGYPWRRIGGLKLMHHKYLVRDAATPQASVWTGSTNLTDASWTLMENNIVVLPSPALAADYAADFEQLWQRGDIADSGAFDTTATTLAYGGQPASVQVLFSPGRGAAIDYDVAHRVVRARQRVLVCSMLLNSGALLAALSDVLRLGRVPVSGIYDRTQMASVLEQWQDVPHNRWKIGAVREIVQAARLVGKDSTPYSPNGRHDFMHNKVLVVDDTVITGSHNYSHSAELNAENVVMIESPALAQAYSRYIAHLMDKYGGRTAPGL